MTAPRSRQGKRFRIRPVLFGAAFCGATAGLVRALEVPGREVRTLPDGSTLTLEGVTFGRGEHRFTTGNRLQRWLGGVVPPQLAPRMGRRSGISEALAPLPAEEDHLVCWFSWSAPRATGTGRSWNLYVEGTEGRFLYGEATLEPVPGPDLIPVRIRSFPRRSSHLRLGVFQRVTAANSSNRLAVEYTVPNPAPGPHPEWTPEPLPATRPAAGVSVTLEEVSRSVTRGLSRKEQPDFQYAGLRLRIETKKGEESPWLPGAITLKDATGNRYRLPWDKDNYESGLRGLWGVMTGSEIPSDPVWKVGVELIRVVDAPRKARFERLVLPRKGEARRPGLSAPIDGGRIVLETITPPRKVVFTGNISGQTYTETWYDVSFHALGLPGPTPLYLTVTQPDGRVDHQQLSAGSGRVSLRTQPGVRTIDLTFAREEGLGLTTSGPTFEFTVRPTLE